MKRHFVTKKLIAWMLSILVVLAFALGANSTLGVARAAVVSYNASAGDGGNLFANGQVVPKDVKFGNRFVVPMPSGVDIELKSPSGLVQSVPSSGDVLASEVGHYQLSYVNTSNNSAYDQFTIRSYVDDEVFLEIENNGATIPEYAPRSTQIELPLATLAYYDEYGVRTNVLNTNSADNFAQVYPNTTQNANQDAVKVEVTSGNAVVPLTSDSNGRLSFMTPDANTSYFVRYSYVNIDAAEYATPVVSREFRVRIQRDFERGPNEKPTLSVDAPARDADLNTKVVLPKATATDDYQKNVRIEVLVTDPNGNPVKVATVDNKTGWATGSSQNNQFFDNDKNMYFYPTVDRGDYRVTYRAYNNAFAENNPENASQQQSFTVRAMDRLQPEVQDIDSSMVPSNWGAKVFRLDEGSVSNDLQNPRPVPLSKQEQVVYFPGSQASQPSNWSTIGGGRDWPYANDSITAIDNVSQVDDSTSRLRVEVSLSNPQGVAVWRFNNIFDTESSQTNTAEEIGPGGEIFAPDATFHQGFDFEAYQAAVNDHNANPAATNIQFDGTYTLSYRLVDAANQVATREFKIVITSQFTNLVRPTIDLTLQDRDRYIVANKDLDLKLPAASVAAIDDAYPTVYYTLTDNDGDEYALKGGERLVWIDDSVYLTKYDTESLTTELEGTDGSNIIDVGNKDGFGTLTLKLSAKDSVGNMSVADRTKPASPTTNPEYIQETITVVGEEFATSKINITPLLNIDTDGNPVRDDAQLDSDNNKAFFTNSNVNLGGATIATGLTLQEREFVGFEVIVKSTNANETQPTAIINNVEVDSYWNNTGTASSPRYDLRIANINFVAVVDGLHSVTIRGFDVNGTQQVYTQYFNVTKSIGSGPITPGTRANIRASTRSTPLGDTIGLYSSHRLNTWSRDNTNPDEHFVRRISGGPFELLGNLFSPRSESTYYFADYWFDNAASTNNDVTDPDSWVYSPEIDDNAELIDNTVSSSKAEDSGDASILIAGDRTVAMHLPVASNNTDYYVLPDFVASNANRNFEIDRPTVTNGSNASGGRIEVVKVEDGKVGNVAVTGDYNVYDGWAFLPSSNGLYTVTVTAKMGSLSATKSFEIIVGTVETPQFSIHAEDQTSDAQRRHSGLSYSMGFNNKFYFNWIYLEDLSGSPAQDSSAAQSQIDARGLEFSKTIKDPSGSVVNTITSRLSAGNGVELNISGNWTVEYKVVDRDGNETIIIDTISVNAPQSGNGISLATISTILIILAVVLIIAAFVYLIRFRKVKVDNTVNRK